MSCGSRAGDDAAAGLPPGDSVLVIGVGNDDRGDDGVGCEVARRLAARGIAAIVHPGDGADLLTTWPLDRPVIIVDAMRSTAPAGTVRRFDAVAEPLPAGAFALSSHALGLAWAVEMGRTLGRLPPALTVIGIEIERTDFGAALSAEVAAAADQLATELTAALQAG